MSWLWRQQRSYNLRLKTTAHPWHYGRPRCLSSSCDAYVERRMLSEYKRPIAVLGIKLQRDAVFTRKHAHFCDMNSFLKSQMFTNIP